jgi:succinate dehydrogenase / fumarate reductase membrane anchor subunit
MSLRTPLSRVLGLGAAKEGVEHWWMQRLSAVALVFLTLWFAFALLSMGELDYQAVRAWIERPVNAALLVLLVITLMYHSQMGVQVVIEDYVSLKPVKIASLIANQFVHVALAAIGLFAVLRAAFGSVA